ncbi:chemosensory receptor C [Elysia marginata]|uniref:Chemosensory receptor C n=1 Tax=Elysia marginata TaxID=1093978 RepID=A0AAV4H3P6_9GAST|nr:chemosensory receptor C [Elysia marginata]
MAANLTEPMNSPIMGLLYKEVLILRLFITHVLVGVTFFGVAANLINITVLAKMGLKGNVNLALFFLSLSDFMYLLFYSLIVMFWFLADNFPHLPLPPQDDILTFAPYVLVPVFYDYSTMVSVFLAVVRCACVVKPLKFKSMFTASRTLSILGVLFCVAMLRSIPSMLSYRLRWSVNPNTNSTYLAFRYADDVSGLVKANDILNKNVLAWLTYITVVTCVILLASKLQAASRFRRTLATTGSSENAKTGGRISEFSVPSKPSSHLESSEANDEKWSGKMSAKDVQVIQSVTLICVIFILSVLPQQVLSFVRLFRSDFYDYNKFMYFNEFVGSCILLFNLLNASVNIFVYFRYNSRYRETFFDLVKMKK